MKLLLSDHAARAHATTIAALAQRHGQPVELLPLSLCSQQGERVPDIDAGWYSRDLFLGGEPGRMSAASHEFFGHFDRSPEPRWLHVMSAGADLSLYKSSLERKILLTTSSGVTSLPIAHTVVAAVMGLGRGFPRWLDAKAHRQWRRTPDADAPRDFPGQHAVIVGLGPIGLEVARLLSALGMRTTGVRHRPEPSPAVDRTLRYEALDEALPDCDWLILCCPLTAITKGLVDARRLQRLPSGVQVINVGRGPVVDEAALIAALRSGQVSGAYLDVFEHEPLDASSPLWEMPNVWLSPHNSATSTGNARRDAELFLDNLDRFLGGQPLRNVMEK